MDVTNLASLVGVSVPAIKLLLTVYSAYVLASFQRLAIPFNCNKNFKLLYIIVVGCLMIYWNYGFDLYHSLLCIFVQYLIILFFGGTILSPGISFAFQLGYLVYGYLKFSTAGYDINWLMPHCILTLRLIGLAFDVHDGHKDEKTVTYDQKPRAIHDYPSLFEILGFSFFYCGFLVGPQFPLQKFRDFLDGKLTNNPGHYPNSVWPAIRRGMTGTVTLIIQTALAQHFYVEHLTTAEYQNSGFPYKLAYLTVTGQVAYIRYVAIWIINEGSCILSGLGYRKDEKTGEVYWDAVRNVILHRYLLAESFQDVINSFNTNTNDWVMRYVYKRLRFVGIREVSQAGALVFLAIWHGIHEGYFTTFFYEFLLMNVEKPMVVILGNWQVVKDMKANPKLSWIPRVFGFLYLHILFGYCTVDFLLRKWEFFHPVRVSVYHHGHVIFGTLFIILKLRSFFGSSRSTKSE